ncbi:hypothetical protein F4604DRAFT_1692100 [Suillus subluteus]|nr:hypothetical protein F4604DRAFT_1692100 [Suillus subluteus]
MTHYTYLIRLFSALNGLCSSITESKHIKAIKEPWRWSSWYNALGQMLLTNQRLDKLAASRVDFRTRGMLLEPPDGESAHPAPTNAEEQTNTDPELPSTIQSASLLDADVSADSEDIDAPTSVLVHVELARTSQGKKHPQNIPALANELNIPNLAELVQQFLIEQLYPDKDPAQIPSGIMDCPRYNGRIQVFHSAVSTFFAPSDLSGVGGMKCEHIRMSPKWRNGHARKDCVFVITDPNIPGMRGMDIVIQWFNRIDDAPDEDTGMWVVSPSSDGNHAHYAVIHVEAIFRSAHLIPVYGTEPLPSSIQSHHVLDIFNLFYVNKYADHHAFEIAW